MAGKPGKARQDADQFRLLVQGVVDYAIFMLDPDGRIVTWNAGAERLKGYTADEIIGQHFSKFYPQEAIDRRWPDHELVVAKHEGRFEDEGWRVRKDGTQFWANVVITALWNEQGEHVGFTKVTRDLTKRKQAEISLQESEERFRLLVEGAVDYAIFMLDPQGHVASWNPGAQRIKGYAPEEIIGQHFSKFYPQEAIDRRWPWHELEVAQREGRFEDEGWRVRKDGTQFWANVVITALRDEHGNLRGFSKITRDMTERKRSEEIARHLAEETAARRMAEQNAQEIAEQRERLRVSLTSIGDGVISTDAEGRIEFINPVAENLLGLSNADARGRMITEVFRVVNEVTREPVKNPAMQALQEGRAIGLANHTVLLAWDGREHPIDDTAAPIRAADGTILGSILVFRDMAERRRAQATIKESESRFRGLMEQAPFSIQILSPEGRTLRVNQAWKDLWGATLEQVADYNVLHDPQLEANGVLPLLQQAFAGRAVSIPAISYDPHATLPGLSDHGDAARWVSAVAYPLKDAAGAVREVVLVHQDITAQRQAELERERFAFLVHNSHDFIALCDLAFQVTFVNREGLRLVGLDTLDKARSCSVTDYFFPEDQSFLMDEFFPSVLQHGHGQVEIRFRHFQTGQPLWFAYSVVVMRDGAGQATGYATISRDITHLKAANEALKAADRRKDEFLATLAHELRNPLAPIRNSLQIIKLPHVDEDTRTRAGDMMERQVQHLVRLVDDLLDVSRVMRNKIELRKELVELASVITRAVETAQPLIDLRGHQLELSLPPQPLRLVVDPIRLVQVIANLLTNAAKYTEPNGWIKLSARAESGHAVISVRDNGIGIAPKMLPQIFELFVQVDHSSTRSQGGLGIGLTLAKNLVELHGGTLEAHSAGLGQGTEFSLRLPLATDSRQLAQAGDGNGEPIPTEGKHRLLVVDDNRDAANSLATLLRLHGHDVHVAHDGPAALQLAAQLQPAMVFLDIGMPGMDGYTVARKLRELQGLERTVLAALTGWGQQDDRRRSAEAGFDHHLVKPLGPEILGKLLSTLSQSEQPRQTRRGSRPHS